MDATPIDFGGARPLAGLQAPMGINSPSPSPMVALAATWTAIHEAAATVGAIAGVDQEQIAVEVQFGLRAELTLDAGLDQPMQDLAEIMRRGISALLTAHVSGGTPQAAALALWGEFLSARRMVLEARIGRVAWGSHP